MRHMSFENLRVYHAAERLASGRTDLRMRAMVLSVHGGPAGMYGYDWFHEFQVYAAKGYAVFFTNPRGSTGFVKNTA